MDKLAPTKSLEDRHRIAADAVRTELEGNKAFCLVSANEATPLLKDFAIIWRTKITALHKDWVVDIGLPKRFPDDAPVACVNDGEQLFLQNPHVLKGGFLCTIPSSAALDSGDPVGLVRYVCDRAKDILEGTSVDDFREEFSYYWSRCASEGSLDVLIVDSIAKLEKSFTAVFCNGSVCVASSVERLNRWVSNFTGKKSELTNERFGVSIDLELPLLPKDYPNTLADLVALSETNDTSAAQLIKNHIIASSAKGLALFVQKQGERSVFGGVIFSGLGLSQARASKFTQGFRPGKVPANLLFSRAEELIRTTKVSRSKIVHVDHHWIHSRGGDGRDLSQKAVLLIGCGSLGGYVAHLLSRAGVGRITVTDNDRLGWENLGRHILGASSIGRWKAEALAEELTRQLPHLEIVGIPKDWRDALELNPKLFSEHDLVISTVADWRCEGPLNELLRKTQKAPFFLAWLEPHAVAGQCLVISQEGGCFECAADVYGKFNDKVANFTPEETISKELGGCTHYQHYGPTALMPVASMVASVAVESLLNTSTESFLNTWVSSAEHFKSVGASPTEVWEEDIKSQGYSKTFRKLWRRSNSCKVCTQKDS